MQPVTTTDPPGLIAWWSIGNTVYMSTTDGKIWQYTTPAQVWSGTVSARWDVNTTANCTGQKYTDGSGVAFRDTDGNGVAVAAASVIVVAGGVQPTSVTFTNNTVNYTISGADNTGIAGTSTVDLSGTGAVTFTNPNTYRGKTTISAGVLRANNGSSGSATGTSSITIQGGTLGGNGTVTGTVTLASGAIAAGADDSTTGKLTTGSETWNGGAAYKWKIGNLGSPNAARGSGGSGVSGASTGSWDELVMSSGNGLTLGALGGANPSFTIKVSDIATLTPAASGIYSWIIAQSPLPVTPPTGYAIGTGPGSNLFVAGTAGGSAAFALDTSGFNLTGNASISLSAFTLELVSNPSGGDNLVLDYTAAPEPRASILVLATLAPLVLAPRRHRSIRCCTTSRRRDWWTHARPSRTTAGRANTIA